MYDDFKFMVKQKVEEINEKKNEFKAGDTITLTISRNGKDTDVQVTLQEVTQGDTLFGDQEAVEN